MKYIVIGILFISLAYLQSCNGCSRSARKRLYKEKIAQNKDTSIKKSKQPQPSIIENSTMSDIEEFDLKTFYQTNIKSVVVIFGNKSKTEGIQGSGFFLNTTNIVITNHHVIEDLNIIFTKTYDEKIFEVTKILAQSEEDDWAILKLDNIEYEYTKVVIATRQPQIGETVYSISNPEGFDFTLSDGIISSFRENKKKIQFSAEVTNGSSGGPLFNKSSEIVGLVTSAVGKANLNFALNIQHIDSKYIK